ncbi:ATP-binding protein [bacterium]|nr:ATP-binding protein [bacterium]
MKPPLIQSIMLGFESDCIIFSVVHPNHLRMQKIDLLHELNSISKTHMLQRNAIDQIMIEFAGRITRSLDIERMSVWLLDYDKQVMTSMGEYDLRDNSFQKDNEIPMSICPEYFAALEKDEILYVPNVLESPITAGLTESYNKPKGVISLLDIPLRFDGSMIGVMCFEKTGDKVKTFDSKVRFFAHAISMVFSSNLEARKRRALQEHLDKELHEKETLLKEIHHRVKNNLAVVSSLVNMQSSKAKDDYHRGLLEDCRGKIQSIADIHDIVYQTSSFSAISVRKYFDQLLEEILQFYDGDDKDISIALKVDDFELSTQALIPLGLIVNEVVTNSFKHAFTNTEGGEVSFTLIKDNGFLQMNIIDNGIGFDEEPTANGNLGLEIIKDLADQIDATFSFYSDEDGVTFHLKAPLE